jgi:hypothetical protein
VSLVTALAQQVTFPGTAVSSVSTGNTPIGTFGGWVPMTFAGGATATLNPITITDVVFDDASSISADQELEVQIGTGALGSEVPGPSYKVTYSNSSVGPCVIPLEIPFSGITTATRVVVRVRNLTATGVTPMAIALNYYERFDSDHQSAAVASYVPYGTAGATLTPQATAWTSTALVVLTAGIASEITVTSFSGKFDPSVSTPQGFELDLWAGPLGLETLLTTVRAGNVSRSGFDLVPLKDGYPVAASTRLTTRQRQSGTNTAAWTVSINYVPTNILPAPPPSGGGTTPTSTNPGTGTSLCGATVPLFWCELHLTTGVAKYSWLDQPINDVAGQIAPRIMDVSPLVRSLSDNTGRLVLGNGWVQLDDSDGAIRSLLLHNTIIQAEIDFYMISEATFRADGFTTATHAFRVGQYTVYDDDLTNDRAVTIHFEDRIGAHAASDVLNQPVPFRTIDNSTFPNVSTALLGKAEPIAYGILSDEGAATWIPMGVAPVFNMGVRVMNGVSVYEGLIAGCATGGVISVYGSDGAGNLVRQSTALYATQIGVPGDSGLWQTLTGGTKKYVVHNNKRYTVIYLLVGSTIGEDFNSGKMPVQVNLAGIEDVGDGTGNVITSGPRQLVHFLTNFLLQNHAGDMNWLPIPSVNNGTYSAINTASSEGVKTQSEVRIPSVGYVGATLIGWDGNQIPAADVLQKFNLSYDFSTGNSRDGQIMLAMETPAAAAVKDFTITKTVLDQYTYQIDRAKLANYVESKVLKMFVTPSQTTLQAHGLPAQWIFLAQYLSTGASITALGGDPAGRKKLPIENWFERDATLQNTGQLWVDVIFHLLQRYSGVGPQWGPGYQTVPVDLCGLDVELGQNYTVTHYAGPVPTTLKFRCLSVALTPPNPKSNTFQVLLTGLDVTHGLVP